METMLLLSPPLLLIPSRRVVKKLLLLVSFVLLLSLWDLAVAEEEEYMVHISKMQLCSVNEPII
jgi:hypothetical protein